MTITAKDFLVWLWLAYEGLGAWVVAAFLSAHSFTLAVPGLSPLVLVPINGVAWFLNLLTIRALILLPSLAGTVAVVIKIRRDNRREAETKSATRISVLN